MRIYAYLRASTKKQDATRARSSLETFAKNKGFKVSKWFTENVSGASLKRPELFDLLETAEHGDGVLIESVDRLTRLNQADWETLRGIIESKGLKIISLDWPTSHDLTKSGNWLTDSIMENVNRLLLDLLAITARNQYETLKKRQAEGIAKAKEKGKFQGRRTKNNEKRKQIKKLLLADFGYNDIAKTVKCGKAMISEVKRDLDNDTK